MKLDIENKILIPFVILLIISIVTLGAVSYWNGYQMLLNNEIENMQRHVEDSMIYMNDLNYQASLGFLNMESARLTAIEYYMENGREGGFIVTNQRAFLFNNYESDSQWMSKLLERIEETPQGILHLDRDVFVYETYENWGWTVGFGISKEIFSQEVMESQKYMILLAIVSLVFSMQAAIFIAFHISKPIRQLADQCGEIGKGNRDSKIQLNRTDEIGILADAVNEMVDNLERNRMKLMEMTRLNEDILRNISTGIMTADREGRLLSLNPAARTMLQSTGLTLEQGKFLREVLQEQILETLSRKEYKNEIYQFQTNGEVDFQYFDVTTSLIAEEQDQIRGVICSFRDITQRKQIENRMEILDRLSSVGQLAAGMAHEIRNPLAGMKTSLQVLKNRLVTEEESVNMRLFQGTIYEIDRINQIITDLLDYARPKKPRYEKADLREILQRALDLTEKNIWEKKIQVELIVRIKEPLVEVDQGQIEQVFLNLIKNAINAMEPGGKLQILMEKKIKRFGQTIHIDFADNGKGIPPDVLEKIFDPFFTTDPQGTGLGLSVVHELIKENKGNIEVKSRVGRGSRFRMILPAYGGNESRKNSEPWTNKGVSQ